jgi:S-adenosylmethionine decarboxylase proenzyme
MNTPLGRHLLIELYESPQDMLDNIPKIKSILIDVVDKIGATLINESFHHFSPYGVSGVVVIAESHITIHTWPEHGYAAIDAFTCDESIDYNYLKEMIVQSFQSKRHESKTINRGEAIKREVLNY